MNMYFVIFVAVWSISIGTILGIMSNRWYRWHNRRHRRIYHINKCPIHGVPPIYLCPICDRPMQTINLIPARSTKHKQGEVKSNTRNDR